MYEDLEIVTESKLVSNISIGTKMTQETGSNNTNKSTAPKPADIQNMIKTINKKEGR